MFALFALFAFSLSLLFWRPQRATKAAKPCFPVKLLTVFGGLDFFHIVFVNVSKLLIRCVRALFACFRFVALLGSSPFGSLLAPRVEYRPVDSQRND